ncbi:unnamed protein product, partial [Gongylonema pulchrum]|uniref:Signal peptide protein n=1 Tax=Gongylonema pulchrum TaxID=637853 RepID=A0A183DDE3_9BILA
MLARVLLLFQNLQCLPQAQQTKQAGLLRALWRIT